MEDRTGCKGNLMPAATTFVEISRRDLPVCSSATFWTNKPIRPTSFKKPFRTTTLGLKFFLEDEPAHLSVVWFVFSSSHDI